MLAYSGVYICQWIRKGIKGEIEDAKSEGIHKTIKITCNAQFLKSVFSKCELKSPSPSGDGLFFSLFLQWLDP